MLCGQTEAPPPRGNDLGAETGQWKVEGSAEADLAEETDASSENTSGTSPTIPPRSQGREGSKDSMETERLPDDSANLQPPLRSAVAPVEPPAQPALGGDPGTHEERTDAEEGLVIDESPADGGRAADGACPQSLRSTPSSGWRGATGHAEAVALADTEMLNCESQVLYPEYGEDEFGAIVSTTSIDDRMGPVISVTSVGARSPPRRHSGSSNIAPRASPRSPVPGVRSQAGMASAMEVQRQKLAAAVERENRWLKNVLTKEVEEAIWIAAGAPMLNKEEVETAEEFQRLHERQTKEICAHKKEDFDRREQVLLERKGAEKKRVDEKWRQLQHQEKLQETVVVDRQAKMIREAEDLAKSNARRQQNAHEQAIIHLEKKKQQHIEQARGLPDDENRTVALLEEQKRLRMVGKEVRREAAHAVERIKTELERQRISNRYSPERIRQFAEEALREAEERARQLLSPRHVGSRSPGPETPGSIGGRRPLTPSKAYPTPVMLSDLSMFFSAASVNVPPAPPAVPPPLLPGFAAFTRSDLPPNPAVLEAQKARPGLESSCDRLLKQVMASPVRSRVAAEATADLSPRSVSAAKRALSPRSGATSERSPASGAGPARRASPAREQTPRTTSPRRHATPNKAGFGSSAPNGRSPATPARDAGRAAR